MSGTFRFEVGDQAVSRWSGYKVTIKSVHWVQVRAAGHVAYVSVYMVEFDDQSQGLLSESDLYTAEEWEAL